MEEVVTFHNKNGNKLFGIVHIPEKNSPSNQKVGINLLNPGIKYRVAPNRLNVKLARRLCDLGYYVLRFDPEGIGDSGGELPENILVADIWEKIQTGLLVDDTITANDFFLKNYPLQQLILIGNCGGAITALLTAKEDERVSDLVLIDAPVNLRTAQQTFAHKVAVGGQKTDFLFEEYIKKIFSLKSWYRILTFQTEFRALWKVINLKLQKTFLKLSSNPGVSKDWTRYYRKHNLNSKFFEAFRTCYENKKPMLFILAGNDPGTEIFQHYFQNGYLAETHKLSNADNLIEIFLIENANHIYTLYEWQESLISKIINWTNRECKTIIK